MVKTNNDHLIASQIKDEVYSQVASKKITVKTLLKRFGYKQRRNEYAIFITEMLLEKG